MSGSTNAVVSDRALGRATLARQLLLWRVDRSVLDTVRWLVGLQAQEPGDPYVGLWSRLAPFDPDEVGRLLVERALVRILVMRGTIHLVTAEDALVLRPLVQPVIDGQLARHPQHAPALRGVDVEPVLAVARELLGEQPRSGRQLRAALAERFPDHDAAALAETCRHRLPLVQVPPRGVWGRSAQVSTTTLEAWVGRPLAAEPSIDEVVLRYLAAFGPATVADVSAWSRLPGQREVVERLRPELVTLRDERGRELVDLPDAPRPPEDVPAPVRFLPTYDNVLLSHADRARFLSDEDRSRLGLAAAPVHGSVLVDGRVGGVWRRDRPAARLVVSVLPQVPREAEGEVEAEGLALLRLFAPDAAAAEVRLTRVG